MQPLRLSVFLALIVVLRCYELSQNLAEFYCVFNGNISNKEQVERDRGNYTLMNVRLQPVLAPALSPIPVVYLEHTDDGVLVRAYILIITEGDDGIGFMTPYNFSGNTDINPPVLAAHSERTLDNMQPLRLCVFLALIAALRCYELSQNLAEFYCVFNGNFSNKEQVERDGGSYTLMDARLQPVLAPELSPIPVVYFENVDDGVLFRAYILIITEGDDGNGFMTSYNFTGNTGIKPGTFDANVIKSFAWENLQGNKDCKGAFKRVAPFVFLFNYPDCKEGAVEGKRESYSSTNTCNNATVVIPLRAAENPTLVPYQFKNYGRKYPLENAPSNYVCDCSTTGN